MEEKKVSKSVLKRLPGYLAYLKNMPENAPAHISATALANALGMGEVQVRKDLAMVSDGGRPKIGYLRETLIDDIEQFLGYDNTTDAVLIGAGKLGQALMGYSGFDEYGLNILAAFDASPKAEKTEEGKPIYHISQLAHFCRTHKVLMGIITVPAEAAQQAPETQETEKKAKKKEKKEKGITFTREQVEKMELAAKQLESVKDQFTRLTAEYDNYRKRTTKEKDGI